MYVGQVTRDFVFLPQGKNVPSDVGIFSFISPAKSDSLVLAVGFLHQGAWGGGFLCMFGFSPDTLSSFIAKPCMLAFFFCPLNSRKQV